MKALNFVIFFLISPLLRAQEENVILPNNLSIQAFGTTPWIFNSDGPFSALNLNYSRRIKILEKSPVVLFTALGWTTGEQRIVYRLNTFHCVSAELSVLVGTNKHHFNLAISHSELFKDLKFTTGERPSEWVVVRTYRYSNLFAGYCFYPKKHGLMFRAGWTPFIILPKQIVPYGFRGYQKYLAGGVTVGYAF